MTWFSGPLLIDHVVSIGARKLQSFSLLWSAPKLVLWSAPKLVKGFFIKYDVLYQMTRSSIRRFDRSTKITILFVALVSSEAGEGSLFNDQVPYYISSLLLNDLVFWSLIN